MDRLKVMLKKNKNKKRKDERKILVEKGTLYSSVTENFNVPKDQSVVPSRFKFGMLDFGTYFKIFLDLYFFLKKKKTKR